MPDTMATEGIEPHDETLVLHVEMSVEAALGIISVDEVRQRLCEINIRDDDVHRKMRRWGMDGVVDWLESRFKAFPSLFPTQYRRAILTLLPTVFPDPDPDKIETLDDAESMNPF